MRLHHYALVLALAVLLGGADDCGTSPYDCDAPEEASGFISADAETTGRYLVRIDPQQVADALGGGIAANDLTALATAMGAVEIDLVDYSDDMFTCEFEDRKEAKAAAKMTGVLWIQEERTLSIPTPVPLPTQRRRLR